MFNPRPRIETLAIADGRACHVVDDALLAPDQLVDLAVAQRARFATAPHNAYPGLELRMPDDFSAKLDDFFRLHLRDRMGARRTLRMYSRLSMVTLPPAWLQPRQWICHRDRLDFAANQRIVASVLYLFRDPALGGTAFYTPTRDDADTAALTRDATVLPTDAFAAKYGLEPGYMTASNAWFEQRLVVPARWNRLIFYDGDVFHSGQIDAPARLSDDPRRGRLSLNGFFTCRRKAA